MKTFMLMTAAALFVLLVVAIVGANAQDANSRDGGNRPAQQGRSDNAGDHGNRY